jgi:SIR2-like domain
MVDATTSLAFSLHSGKGVYALLLGSGISRASGIPTGWEVVLDLIRKAAQLQGLDCGSDAATWYESRYGKQPDYAEILEMVAKTSAERGQVLRGYFEPNEEEREQGKKMPTAAHRAIAELVAGEYIRVIVTTNFDRLLEQALEAAGVVPTVISSADAILGAMPLAHSQCTVIKVHGDYLDTRLKNTPDEIGLYDDATNRLLDQVFDQYGLIICGWSADWDVALRAAIERCPNRRFTTYWSAYRPVAGAARRLCDLRMAQVIEGQDADTFFRDLAVKVASLAEIDAPHPLSKQMALAAVKRYLVEPRDRIRLRELMWAETRKVQQKLSEEQFSFRGLLRGTGQLADRMPAYEAAIDSLLAMLIAGVYHGGKSHRSIWIQCLERMSRHSEKPVDYADWARFGLYPVFLLFYGCGIAAVAAGRYSTLLSLLRRGRSMREGTEKNLWFRAAETDSFRLYEGARSAIDGNARIPVFKISHHIQNLLRPMFAEYLPSESEYLRTFDRFEYLAALVFADLYEKEHPTYGSVWVPIGRFAERYKTLFPQVQAEIEQKGDQWPLLKAGAFDGSLDRLLSLKKKLDEWASNVAMHNGFW